MVFLKVVFLMMMLTVVASGEEEKGWVILVVEKTVVVNLGVEKTAAVMQAEEMMVAEMTEAVQL